MKKKLKKCFKFLILILTTILLIIVLKNTYSKYISNSEAKIIGELGNWTIKVNDTDITEALTDKEVSERLSNFKSTGVSAMDAFLKMFNRYISFEIKDFKWNWDEYSHVIDKKIAPGMKGSFTINIDTTEVDTSFNYLLMINYQKMVDTNIKLVSYELQDDDKDGDSSTIEFFDEEKELLDSDENSYGWMLLRNKPYEKDISKQDNTDKITFNFEWDPDVDDEKDTNLGNMSYETKDISIPIFMMFEQGEDTIMY